LFKKKKKKKKKKNKKKSFLLKNKINKDTQQNLTISSPLEAHKTHTVCFGIVGVDVSYENPLFASIERDHSDIDFQKESGGIGGSGKKPKKVLTFYELDLSVNHVVKKMKLKLMKQVIF
jgi:splicing factor 3B subunit 3